MVRAAGRRGVSVDLGTLGPPGGVRAGRSDSEQAQATRQEVNGWIRTAVGKRGRLAAAAPLDFDAVLRDPRDWRRLRPGYGSGGSALPRPPGYPAPVPHAPAPAPPAGHPP